LASAAGREKKAAHARWEGDPREALIGKREKGVFATPGYAHEKKRARAGGPPGEEKKGGRGRLWVKKESAAAHVAKTRE